MPAPPLSTVRLELRPATAEDAAAVLAWQRANRTHLQAWEPLRADAFYTLEAQRARLQAQADATASGAALHWLIVCKQRDVLIGECALTNLVRGVFQACHLGFALAASAQGQGLMAEALGSVIEHAFAELDLHRIMANYRPENLRSAQLLRRLGFEREGFARAYLKINGQWADHVLTSLLNPAHAS